MGAQFEFVGRALRRRNEAEAMGYLHAVDSKDPLTEGEDTWAIARDGEVWWWDGERLVPTSPDEAAMVREVDALRRLRDWEGNARPMPVRSPARKWTQRSHTVWLMIVGRLLSRRAREGHTTAPAQEDEVQARS